MVMYLLYAVAIQKIPILQFASSASHQHRILYIHTMLRGVRSTAFQGCSESLAMASPTITTFKCIMPPALVS